MNFIELAKKRYSVRKFDVKPVEQEKLDLILEAGRIAPTAANLQSQKLLILNKKDTLDKLKDCTPFHFDAPLAIIVCSDSNVSWKRSFDDKDFGEVDASIVTTHMLLEISNLGLGTTWVAHFDPFKARELFSIPDNLTPIAILPIGYISVNSTPSTKHSDRLDISNTVSYNSF